MKHEQPEPIGGGRFAKMTLVIDCEGDDALTLSALALASQMENIFRFHCSMLDGNSASPRLSGALLDRDDDCGCR